jgi:hypothetical protein
MRSGTGLPPPRLPIENVVQFPEHIQWSVESWLTVIVPTDLIPLPEKLSGWLGDADAGAVVGAAEVSTTVCVMVRTLVLPQAERPRASAPRTATLLMPTVIIASGTDTALPRRAGVAA